MNNLFNDIVDESNETLLRAIERTKDAQWLDKVSRSNDWQLLRKAAQNPHTNQDALDRMSDHPNDIVAWHIAGSDNPRQSTLDKLADHKSDEVVWKALHHPNTHTATVRKLTNHKNEAIRNAARKILQSRH